MSERERDRETERDIERDRERERPYACLILHAHTGILDIHTLFQ